MTLSVVWDDSLPKDEGPKSTVQRWNEWFEAVGDEQSHRSWKAAKSIHTDPVKLNQWAIIIEMNRLDRLEKYEEETTL